MDFYFIFLINSLASFFSVNAIDVAVSLKSFSWHEAADNEQLELLSIDHFSQDGWDSLSRANFEDRDLWVAARAKYAPPVSREGCARWKSSCVSNLVPAGSLGDCLRNCQGDSKYMLLKGDMCRCFEMNEDCIQQTTDPCDDKCRNNPNDWCGGEYGTEALYYTGPFGNITYNVSIEHGLISCIVLKYNDLKKFLSGENCEATTARRCICKRNSEVFEGDIIKPSTWFEASKLCRKLNAHLYFDLRPDNITQNRSTFWTSLRRGLSIKWTKKTDSEYPFCVYVRLNNRSNLMLYAGDCNTSKQYLHWTGQKEDTSDDGKSGAWLIALLVFLVFCLPSVGLACYISGRRRDKRDLPPVRFKAPRRQSPTRSLLSQLSQRPPIRRPDNVTIECDYDYVKVSDTDFCFDDKLSNLEPPYSTNRRFQNRQDSLYDNKTLPRGHSGNFLSPNLYNTIDCGYGRSSKRLSRKPLFDDQRSHSLDRKSSNKSSAKNFFPYELAKY